VSLDLLIVLLVTLSFVGSRSHAGLPCQIAAIDEAREQAKILFITTLDTVPDTVLVLDESGKIRQTNTAAENYFRSTGSNWASPE